MAIAIPAIKISLPEGKDYSRHLCILHSSYNSKSSLTLLGLPWPLPLFHTHTHTHFYFCGLCSLLSLYNHLVVHAALFFSPLWLSAAGKTPFLVKTNSPPTPMSACEFWIWLKNNTRLCQLTSIHGLQSQGTLMSSISATSFPRTALSNMATTGHMWLWALEYG